MSESVLLGDEALALGAVHAGLSCGFDILELHQLKS